MGIDAAKSFQAAPYSLSLSAGLPTHATGDGRLLRDEHEQGDLTGWYGNVVLYEYCPVPGHGLVLPSVCATQLAGARRTSVAP